MICRYYICGRGGLPVIFVVVVSVACLSEFPESVSAANKETRRNICLSDVRASIVSATEVTLQWEFDCPDVRDGKIVSVKYKIYYSHKEFLACGRSKRPDTSRGPGRDNFELDDVTAIVIRRLHPFSVYDFSVKALPEFAEEDFRGHRNRRRRIPDESHLSVSTAEGVPNIRPGRSDNESKSYPNSLTFFWSPTPSSECDLFNGKADSYHYVLKGRDPWTIGEDGSGVISRRTTNLTYGRFDGLLPLSRYTLLVHVVNGAGVDTETGLINEAKGLEIRARTRPSSIPLHPPRDLTVIPIERGFYVYWKPPYPPSAYVSGYRLRWKESLKEGWMNETDVEHDSFNCNGNDSHVKFPVDITSANTLICYVLELDPSKMGSNRVSSSSINYTFDVVAITAKGKMSPWSPTVTSAIWKASIGDGGSLGAMIAIAVIVSVVIVLIVIVCTRFACKHVVSAPRGRPNYKNVPLYEGRYPRSLRSVPLADACRGVNGGPSTAATLDPPLPRGDGDGTGSGFHSLRSNTVGVSPSQSFQNSDGKKSKKNPAKDYQHLLLPALGRISRSGSIQGTPLPPVPPPTEPIYEELCQETLLNKPSQQQQRHPSGQSLMVFMHGSSVKSPTRSRCASESGATLSPESPNEGIVMVNFIKKSNVSEGFVNDNSEDEFLEPAPQHLATTTGATDGISEDNYLTPRRRQDPDDQCTAPDSSAISPETTLDVTTETPSDVVDTEYLKPTFNQFDTMNGRDLLSPPTEDPPPIPVQSYAAPNQYPEST